LLDCPKNAVEFMFDFGWTSALFFGGAALCFWVEQRFVFGWSSALALQNGRSKMSSRASLSRDCEAKASRGTLCFCCRRHDDIRGTTMQHTLRSALVLALLGVTPALLAQIPGGGMGVAGGSHMSGAAGHNGLGAAHGAGFRPGRPGIVGGSHHHGFHNNRFFSPFWSTAFWWDDGYSGPDDQVMVQQPAPVVVQQAAAPVQEVKPANPLLIELQGDRFVRVTGNGVNLPVGASRQITAERSELSPAVLVFRDGRRQEVSSYSIIGPVLYASGSYWTNGYWTQKILLADLDLPATLQANQERGVNFVLPSAPDQVVTRP
jgi:hypothetical protein